MNDTFDIKRAKRDGKALTLNEIGSECVAHIELWLQDASGIDCACVVQLPSGNHQDRAFDEIRNIPAAEPSLYGYCPQCGARGVSRERRPDGDDRCVNGHTYPSRHAVRQQPPTPSPVEHTVAVAIWGRDGEYVATAKHSTQVSFAAASGEWRGCNEVLPRIELHFRDGVPIACTKDGVRVKLMPRVGDIHKHTWDLNSKLAAARKELADTLMKYGNEVARLQTALDAASRELAEAKAEVRVESVDAERYHRLLTERDETVREFVRLLDSAQATNKRLHTEWDKTQNQLADLRALWERASRAGVQICHNDDQGFWLHSYGYGGRLWRDGGWERLGSAGAGEPEFGRLAAALPAALNALDGEAK